MAVSSLDKDVATRLFRMLAVNEHAAASVKRDHASYAKLSLLTQQAQLLQQQAIQTVNKVAKKAAAADDEIKLTCTALSTEFDDSASRVLTLLDVNEKTVAMVKRDTPASAKLSLLGEQVECLQQQAQEAVEDAKLNAYLSHLTAGTVAKLVCGTMYYLYTQNGKEVLSRIAPQEWANYDEYHGRYLYDYDFTFRKQLDEHEKEQERQERVLLLPNCVAGKGNSWGGLHVAGFGEIKPAPAAAAVAESDVVKPSETGLPATTLPPPKPMCIRDGEPPAAVAGYGSMMCASMLCASKSHTLHEYEHELKPVQTVSLWLMKAMLREEPPRRQQSAMTARWQDDP
eukprot:CAMPEP_0119349122 /NCGR_PEP_ID=MMETSP1333-20130426/109392_1 /TAXON_ID=418940 /ORGANISM="Scyphosphaera apsteinii, Strain RCC1455" /LENGTH=341 /DNA_ID=CAMNT_0007361717 /DNA_START=14 /DNA_END=1040 /DNA_ORIENTATION=-